MKNFKKVISSVIAFAIAASSFAAVSASSFSDVADTASYAEAVDVLAALGIVNGYEEDGAFTFKPEGEITRAEAATMIVGALNMTEDAKNSSSSCQFADVNEKASWAAGYVNVGVSEGFINGRSADEFDPQANVTYAEMCVMLTKITDYADYATSNIKEGDPWYKAYTDMAASAGLNKGVSVPLTSALKRGHVAQMIYNALVTPKLGIVEYSFVDNKYAPLDGTYSPEFKTILSEKFDGYIVTAEVLGTPKSTGNNGEVNLNITKAAWWDEAKVEAGKRTVYEAGVKIDPSMTGIEDQLFQSGTAVLIVDALDDVEMIYFSANSKMETKEVALDDYVLQADRGATTFAAGNGIKFGTGSPVRVNAAAELYVNGARYYGPRTQVQTGVDAQGQPIYVYSYNVTDGILDKFLGNGIGNVTFVKTDKTANEFDKIFVNYYEVGKVTSVTYKGEKTTVRFTTVNDTPKYWGYDAQNNYTVLTNGTDWKIGSSVVIEIDDEEVLDEEVDIVVEKNGSAIELKELAKDDVVAMAIDFNGQYGTPNSQKTVRNPAFIKVLATDETVKGMVVDYDDDYGTYTIGENDYPFVGYITGKLDVATTYDLVLDPFGRILDEGEAVSTGAKFAIVEKYDSNSEKVSLLLADGSTASYEVHSSSTLTIANLADTTGAGFLKPNGTLAPVQDRVVTYTISGGAVKMAAATTRTQIQGKEFNKNTDKLGAVSVTEELNIINAQAHVESASPSISDYEKFDAADFKSDVDYDGYAYKTGDVYSFLVITNVGTTFTEDSRFAVITKDPMSKIYDGATCIGAEALYNGEAITLYWDVATVAQATVNDGTNNVQVAEGDVIFFTTDSEGYIKTAHKVYEINYNAQGQYSNSVNTANAAFTAMAPGAYKTNDWNFTFSKAGQLAAADIQLVAGYVTEVKNNSITFGVVSNGTDPVTGTVYNNVIDGNVYEKQDGSAGLFTFGIASDAKAYIFDAAYEATQTYKKFSAVDAASIPESVLVEVLDNNGQSVDDIYDASTSILNDAFALIVNEDVVCIFVNCPV